jgi:hypothetical protein
MITTMRAMAAIASAAALTTAAATAALAGQDASAGPARAAAAVAGSPAAASTAAGSTAAGSTAAGCSPQNLSAGLHGSQVGLGNRGFILTLTNTGTSSCGLDGYPGLGLEDGAHHVLPSHTSWGGTYFDNDPGAHVIVLSPGETASADVAYPAGSGGSADSVATYLEVTPPNAFQHLAIRIQGAPVRIYHGNLSVTAMASHTPYSP